MAIFGYLLISSAKEVFVSDFVQHQDPFLVLFMVFTLAQFVLLLSNIKRFKVWQKEIIRYWRFFIALNATTLLAWSGLYFAIKYWEPAIVMTVVAAISPLAVMGMHYFGWSQTPINSKEKVAAWGILASCLFLIAMNFQGQSSLGDITKIDFALGLLTACGCAIGVVSTSEMLLQGRQKGLSRGMLFSGRFWFLILVSAVAMPNDIKLLPTFLENFWVFLLLATGGILLPFYLFQIGVERTHTLTTMIVLATAPVITFFFQLASGRFSFSWSVFFGVLLVVFFSSYGVRHKTS